MLVPTAGVMAFPPAIGGSFAPRPDAAGNFAPAADGGQAPVAVDAGAPAKPDAGMSPSAAWVATSCSASEVNVLAGAVQLARAVDYIAVYLSYPHGTGMAGPFPAGTTTLGKTGTPCANAADSAACATALAAFVVPDASCDQGGACRPFAVTTAKNSVQRIDSQADLVSLLGMIDTPTEASIAAVWNGLTVACPGMYTQGARGTEVSKTADGYSVRSEWSKCGGPAYRETTDVATDGTMSKLISQIIGMSNCAIGRRPVGLQAAAPHSMHSPLGGFFANAARLEAASVYAFERLARELSQLGAPSELIADAGVSALDELRHAQLVAALARRYGAEPSAPSVTAQGVRSRLEIALENAVEGCVRETFGALVAHHQAALARDPNVALSMLSVAADETRHAELAWRVAGWLEPRLSEAERKLVRCAQRAALLELAVEVSAPGLSSDDERIVGWPGAELRGALVTRMAGMLRIG
jgi:hypothetical protein